MWQAVFCCDKGLLNLYELKRSYCIILFLCWPWLHAVPFLLLPVTSGHLGALVNVSRQFASCSDLRPAKLSHILANAVKNSVTGWRTGSPVMLMLSGVSSCILLACLSSVWSNAIAFVCIHSWLLAALGHPISEECWPAWPALSPTSRKLPANSSVTSVTHASRANHR